MSKVPAHAHAFPIRFERRLGRTRAVVVEPYMPMDKVANSLHPGASERCMAEHLPGGIGQQIGLAVAAAEEELHALVGQFFNGMLITVWLLQLHIRWHVDHALRRQREPAYRCNQPAAQIAE